MLTPKLFALLPDYISTPDSMTIDKHGNLVLSCPNYADGQPGVVVRFSKDREISKWFEVPVHPETGVARNMGIAFDEDWNVYLCDNQGWSGAEELQFKGRMLKVTVDDDGNILKWTTVAQNMEHPNGVRVRDGYMYVTQSCLSRVQHPSGKLVSCVYRFGLDEENIEVTNTLEDKHIIATFVTQNPQVQYGADGIAFDKDGNLYVGNFGDGEIYRITFNQDGSVKENKPFAKDPEQLVSTDGMVFDTDGSMYIADFNVNAICKMSPDGKLTRIAQSPDTDGLHGELDQPGEPIVWNGLLIASCFDLVTDETKVNTAHEMPATLSFMEL